MHKRSHWSVAKQIADNHCSSRLHGYALKLGSIMPDLLAHTYLAGHKYDTTAARVEENLTKLKDRGTWTMSDCFRLGYNLHYLEDYFTYPHNSHFDGGFIDHCRYEFRLARALDSYMEQDEADRTPAFPPIQNNSVSVILQEHHAAYMKAEPSPENDIKYITFAAEAVAQEMFAAFDAQAASRAFTTAAVAPAAPAAVAEI